jgi:hypothetical protein
MATRGDGAPPRYGNKLSQAYEELQQYCTELETANSCPRCAAKAKGGEKKPQPQASTEDPIVHDSGVVKLCPIFFAF